MHIAILGWYSNDNAGDDRFEYVMRRLLAPHKVVPLEIWDSSASILRHCDYAIVGGGTMFYEGNDTAQRLTRLLSLARVRRYAMWSIGVEPGCDDREKRALASLIARADQCFVRDSGSLRVCPEGARVRIAPDLTWYCPYPQAGKNDSQQIALNLNSTAGATPAKALVDELAKAGYAMSGWPLYFGGEYNDFSILSQAGLQSPTCFLESPLYLSRAVVAMRYHAMVFSAQAGVPFVPIKSGRKQEFFLEQIGYPVKPVPLDDPVGIRQTLAIVIREEDAIRTLLREQGSALAQEALSYVEFGRQLRVNSAPMIRLRKHAGRIWRGLRQEPKAAAIERAPASNSACAEPVTIELAPTER